MNVVSRGARNAFRNVVRTISIVTIVGLSIGLSLTMLIAHQAVGKKIDSVKAAVGNTISISPAGVRGFEGGGNPLTESQVAFISKQAHVVSVNETLNDRLTSSNTNLQSSIEAGTLGRRFSGNNGTSFTPPSGGGDQAGGQQSTAASFTPPVTVIGINDPTVQTSSEQQGTFKLTSGKLYAKDATDNVAVVGKELASKNNLKVGSTFTAYSTTVTVVGIFDSGNTFSNSQLYMPLATVQKLSDQAGNISSATVTVDSISNVSSLTKTLAAKLGSAADVTNDAEQAKTSIAPLENIQTISLYSLVGAVIAGSVIILLTMVMIVRERRREIGVIKAIGASNLRIMAQFTVEAITLTSLAAVVGVVIGVIGGNPITHLLVTNSTSSSGQAGPSGPGGGARRGFGFVRDNVSTIHAAVGWEIIIWGLAAALIIAIVGSALASLFISKIRPAEVMRAE